MRGASGVNLVMGPDGKIRVACTRPPLRTYYCAPDGRLYVGEEALPEGAAPQSFERAPWCVVLRAAADFHLPLCPSCAAYVAFAIAKYAPN